MLGYTSVSSHEPSQGSRVRALVLLGAVATCSPRTLTLVEIYSDGGHRPPSIDGNLGDASSTANPGWIFGFSVGSSGALTAVTGSPWQAGIKPNAIASVTP